MHVPLGPLGTKSSQPDRRHKVLAWLCACCLILPKNVQKMGRLKNGFLRQPSSRSKTFTTSLSQPQGCLESPQLALQPLWIDGKCKKWVLSPWGPRLHPASTSELRNGTRKVHQGRGRAEGTQRDLPGRREPQGRACRLVVHRAVVGVRAWLRTRPCSAGKSTM